MYLSCSLHRQDDDKHHASYHPPFSSLANPLPHTKKRVRKQNATLPMHPCLPQSNDSNRTRPILTSFELSAELLHNHGSNGLASSDSTSRRSPSPSKLVGFSAAGQWLVGVDANVGGDKACRDGVHWRVSRRVDGSSD